MNMKVMNKYAVKKSHILIVNATNVCRLFLDFYFSRIQVHTLSTLSQYTSFQNFWIIADAALYFLDMHWPFDRRNEWFRAGDNWEQGAISIDMPFPERHDGQWRHRPVLHYLGCVALPRYHFILVPQWSACATLCFRRIGCADKPRFAAANGRDIEKNA